VSTFGTWIAFDAFPLIAILVLDAGPVGVSLLAACGLAVGALIAVPLGPWVEHRRKRRVMIAMDLVRFGALLSVPLAFLLGVLAFWQLVVVAVAVAAADIAFRAASGAYLKRLLPPDDLLVASGRFEATVWTATAIGPPAGGALLALAGPVTTVVVNAVSFVLSATALRAIGEAEPQPVRVAAAPRGREIAEGWRTIWASPALRPLFLNTVLVNALILVSAPLIAVLMLGDLGFAAWEYALAFGLPCVAGLAGSRLSRPLVARFGPAPVLRWFGTLRAVAPIGLAFVWAGSGGLVFVIVLQLALVACVGVFNPVLVTTRLHHAPADRVARVLAAWSVSNNATVAALTAGWGLLASAIGVRPAIALAGTALLATPLLLRHVTTDRVAPEAPSSPRYAGEPARVAVTTLYAAPTTPARCRTWRRRTTGAGRASR
jgi:MFS family permease